MIRRRCAHLVWVALVGIACAVPETSSPPAGLPQPETAEMEAPVAELLNEARGAVLQAPDSAEAWGNLGSLYDAHSLFAEAAICYRSALALDPASFPWAYLLAVVRDIEGAEIDEIQTLFLAARTLRPDYAPSYIRLGEALHRAGRQEAAVTELRRAVELMPDSAVARRGLGRVLLALEQFDEALTQLERALELEPEDRAVYSSLSQAYLSLGRTSDAEAMVQRSVGLGPIHVLHDPVWDEWVFARAVSSTRAFRRALARIREGDPDAAIADLELVRRARPDHEASVAYWLGIAHWRAGRLDQAIEHLETALAAAPRMNDARLALADVLRENGATEAAAAHYAEALRLDPDNEPARAGLQAASTD